MFIFSFLTLTDTLVLLGLVVVSVFIYQFYIAPQSTSYANLPGPPLDSYLWGNMQGLMRCVLRFPRLRVSLASRRDADPAFTWADQLRAWCRPREPRPQVWQDAAVRGLHGRASVSLLELPGWAPPRSPAGRLAAGFPSSDADALPRACRPAGPALLHGRPACHQPVRLPLTPRLSPREPSRPLPSDASLTPSTSCTRAPSILSNGYDYPKPDRVRNKLEEILGQGILTSEGALMPPCRRQRAVTLTGAVLDAVDQATCTRSRCALSALTSIGCKIVATDWSRTCSCCFLSLPA